MSGFTIPEIDPSKFAKFGKPSSEPDYIATNVRGRDAAGRLAFNTGFSWLGGFTVGGAYGAQQGWAGAPSPIFKVRMNSVLNGISKHGSKVGNALAVIGKAIYFSMLVVN